MKYIFWPDTQTHVQLNSNLHSFANEPTLLSQTTLLPNHAGKKKEILLPTTPLTYL